MANETINLKKLRNELRPNGTLPSEPASLPEPDTRSHEYTPHPADHHGYGLPLLSWDTLEFELDMSKSVSLAVLGIGLILSGIITFFAWNYLFGFFLVVAGGLTLSHAFRVPRTVHCAVTSMGVRMGDRVYEFESLKSFWVDYSPPHARELMIVSKRALMPHLKIPLGDVDPLELREILLRFLQEEQHETSLTDVISKRIGF